VQKAKTILISITDAAYIAGIVDGEGTLSLSLSMPKRGGYHFGVRVCVTNTNTSLLKYLKKRVGGSIQKKPSYKGLLPCYRWQICHRGEVRQFLQLIYPYLIIKKRHAEIIMEFLDDFVTLQKKSDEIKQEEIGRRVALWAEIKSLQVR